MTESEFVLDVIGKQVHVFGSQRGLADDLGISKQYLSDVLAHRRPVSEQLAAKLGYRRVVSFEPARGAVAK